MTISFQRARPQDATPLATLHTSIAEHLTSAQGFGPWSSKATEKALLLAMRTSRVFVAWSGKDLIGTFRLATKKPWAIDTSYFSPCNRPLYVLAMAVTPYRQRQGIGRACLDEAKRVAAELKADSLRLDAFDAPAGAGDFYTRCGWLERGRVLYKGVPLIYFEWLL